MNEKAPILYYSPGSCSLAVHIVLEEIGKPFELKQLLTDRGDAKQPEFRRLNPKGRVPVLIENDKALTEAPAILMHLANCNPEADLSPVGNEEIFRALEWFNWLSGTVHSGAIRQIWRPEYFTKDAEGQSGIVAQGQENLAEAHRLIEARLRKGSWGLGSRYTVLDPYLLVFFRWGNRMQVPMSERYPVWTNHTERMIERAAVKNALTTEGISVWE